MKKMKLDKIKIKEYFKQTPPSEEKMCECREFWRYEGKQDRPIVLDSKGFLVDGYVMYLILKEHKEEYAMVRKLKKPRYINHPTIYIYGKHPNSKDMKTYIWRVPESWNEWVDDLQIGDMIYCRTKNGVSPVIVQEVEILRKCPIKAPVRKVVSKRIVRDGMTVADEKIAIKEQF